MTTKTVVFATRLFFSFFACLFFLLFCETKVADAAYKIEGAGFFAEIHPTADSLPVYRFYNQASDKHFYTLSEEEKSLITDQHPEWGHQYEGIAFYAYSWQKTGTLPVYRFYNNKTDNHFYTLSQEEKSLITDQHPEWGYINEGIAFYSYPDPDKSALNIPIFRFYNNASDRHFYTGSEIEKSYVLNGNLGPDISVGLWSVSREDSSEQRFKVKSDTSYVILDNQEKPIVTVPGGTQTSVWYDSEKQLKIKNELIETTVPQTVSFLSENSNPETIFDVSKPDSSNDLYRGKIKIRYSESSKKIWIINVLPLEQYLWGIGEITGTGDMNYNRAMSTAFRTYAFWKILFSTKYANEGFVVDATPGNQLYHGYTWELNHPRLKQAAQDTIGSITKYQESVALTPYSSWTDGRTRSFEERWGSKNYPWCQSVKDDFGKHPTLSTTELEAQGNHMVGISAHGALHLATEKQWEWQRILQYYLPGIYITEAY